LSQKIQVQLSAVRVDPAAEAAAAAADLITQDNTPQGLKAVRTSPDQIIMREAAAAAEQELRAVPEDHLELKVLEQQQQARQAVRQLVVLVGPTGRAARPAGAEVIRAQQDRPAPHILRRDGQVQVGRVEQQARLVFAETLSSEIQV
jgi:hypothetical protein